MKNECECQVTYCVLSETDSDGICHYSVICKGTFGEELCCISDISRNEKRAVDFCTFLNRNKISVVHFYDVFDDFFA